MNSNKLRQDFAILSAKLKGKPVVYLDSACQSLKPRQVVDKMNEYYNDYPACAGRSHHKLGKRVGDEVDKARMICAKFFNAKKPEEIIFTKNATESLNLVANSLGLQKGDVVITTDKEHNSNLLPWQMQSKKSAIIHKIVEFGNIEALKQAFENNKGKIKLVSMVQTSNLDGTSIPAKEISKLCHDNDALFMIDGAQSAPHKPIDLKRLDADFFACSGHKMLAPTGTGMLYGKEDLLEMLQPFIVGGETVVETTYETAEFADIPHKFEAGLQNYSGIIGFGAALEYLNKIGMAEIEKHDFILNKKITEDLEGFGLKGLEILGPSDAGQRAGIFSFNIKNMDTHSIAIMLDEAANIMVRSGAHCCHSWFNANGLKGSVRASLYLYNNEDDCRIFCENLRKIAGMAK